MKSIVEDLSSFFGRSKKVLAIQRRARCEDEERMSMLLQQLSGKLVEVKDCLEAVEQLQSEEKKNQRKKNQNPPKRGRVDGEEGENPLALVEERGGREKRAARSVNERVEKNYVEEVVEEEPAEVGVVKKAPAKKLTDGGPCLVEGTEEMVFFALSNEQEDKRFECPLLSSEEDESVTVERKHLQPVEFASLDLGMQNRYLSLLASDIARRFHLNAPVLFKDHGQDMLSVRDAVIKDDSKVGSFFDSIGKHAMASKQLNAANNTVLMLAATLHASLAAGKEEGWYASFKQQLSEFCTNCAMKVSTVERYLVAGSLMLRSRVLACMLPSFLVLNAEAIGRLLEDEVVVERWEGLENRGEIEIEGGEEVVVEEGTKEGRESTGEFFSYEELCLGGEHFSRTRVLDEMGELEFA